MSLERGIRKVRRVPGRGSLEDPGTSLTFCCSIRFQLQPEDSLPASTGHTRGSGSCTEPRGKGRQEEGEVLGLAR